MFGFCLWLIEMIIKSEILEIYGDGMSLFAGLTEINF
jgi:hypothetical protein